MLHHEQFMPHHMTAACNENSRNSMQQQQQQQQPAASPSDDNSMSTATPPHQISRASPASTALVMSTNNIASVAPSSRQLTPHSNGSTPPSSSDNNSSNSNAPPNPMMRQFASCHSKSMSAGVVVPVPGISNNLATGMHHPQHHHQQQHHIINNTIAHHQNHQNQLAAHHQRQMSGGGGGAAARQQHQMQHANKQVIREHRSHHHRSVSQQARQAAVQAQQQQQPQDAHHQQQQQHFAAAHHNGSTNFQTLGSSSIVLSSSNGNNNANNNNNHHRSASTQLSSNTLMTNNNNNNSHHQNNPHPVVAQRHAQRIGTNHQDFTQQQHVTNSIWSIDENLSKSHGKLTASGYHLAAAAAAHAPYLFNPSTTDLSCDNISNALIASVTGGHNDAGGPAPAYYLHTNNSNAATGSHHHHHHHHSSQAHSLAATSACTLRSRALVATAAATSKQPEFLPICDLMFNLISMIVYFCENVFGLMALIALYYHASSKYWTLCGGAFMFGSNLLCQYLSLRWLFKMKLEECRRKREAQEELEDEEECERRFYNQQRGTGANNNTGTGTGTGTGDSGGGTSSASSAAASIRQAAYQCGSCTWLPDGATEVQLKFLLNIALDAIMHIFCLGFILRYIKLVIPVSDSSRVKRETRDLCMLRMIHGFVQSAPLLLLQSYMVCSQNYGTSIVNLSTTSVLLSLCNVCWAQASFTKYARKKYMHKFTLTWLGILCQLLWRLGMISSRVAALTIYAVYYGYWVLVVMALHWFTMFMWHMKPGNFLRDEMSLSRGKKLLLASGASWIYCFDYMNFEEHNSVAKMIAYYLIMFVENNLLFTVSLTLSTQVTWFKSTSILVVYLGFAFGMLFMFIYYKYFHIQVLNNGLSCSQDSIDSIADQLTSAGKKVAGFKPGTLRLKSEDSLSAVASHRGANSGLHHLPHQHQHQHHHHKYPGNIISATLRTGSHPEIARSCNEKPPYLTSNHHHTNNQHLQLQGSGVFSCKLPLAVVKKQSARRSNN